jgi:phosphoenolpyruvate synthase/pyruvate phosphate dikinase
MTLTQVWGSLLIFLLVPILGGLPLIDWLTYALSRKRLRQLGTGNVSVSAAFYHGGKVAGIFAVLSEAFKGIAAVLLARSFFPTNPEWELIALIALVFGRYWIGKGAGTTNVTWGYIVHDPISALLVFLIGGIGFTILRERELGRISVLILFPILTELRHSNSALTGSAIALACLLGWIYKQIPDDLDLEAANSKSQPMFKFFRGDRGVASLDQVLDANRVGAKAATLAKLKRLGYSVPMGWVLLPGDDPEELVSFLQPKPEEPLIVRSSAIGEDGMFASAAGQYLTIPDVTRKPHLLPAITQCLESYADGAGYRRDRGVAEASMAVLVQRQIKGVFSGVTFSRDPIARQGEAVVIEAIAGGCEQIVSGRVKPESYRVMLEGKIEGEGQVPQDLIQQVAAIARKIESQFNGIPQDIEWSYDGQILWILQARPITTLLPIWTRKIAAEVIPGKIRPLTWAINRPLTCGVWGEIFTIVLGDRALGLDFNETATLHYSQAYFNASLLGQIFLKMGLPPESLEFLTRGAKFSKPPILSTLRNTPGLLRLLQREFRIEKDFQRDNQKYFRDAIAQFTTHPASDLAPPALLNRIDQILDLLKKATYYSILAPLSVALRKAIAKVPDEEIDNSRTPEVAALRSLQSLALSAQPLLNSENIFDTLSTTPEGQKILNQFDKFLNEYGYLSEVGTDIAVSTWRENPQPIRDLFTQYCLHPTQLAEPTRSKHSIQGRVDLKGQVTEIYSRLLAELRWSFIALESIWLESGELTQAGDIFFLEYEEIRQAILANHEISKQRILQRRSQFEQAPDQVPYLVYGEDPPEPLLNDWQASERLQGIGASPGQVEGRIKVMRSLSGMTVDLNTILVVPYTDSGWAPILAQVGGLIAEVGGRLSHGAIVAREYKIPAVMDIANATHILQDGQLVRIDGQKGIVEIL